MKPKLKSAAYLGIAAIVTTLVLGNIFYLTNFLNEKNKNREKAVQIYSLNTDKDELLKQTRDLSLELESKTSKNSELLSSISAANTKLKVQKLKIEKLARENGSVKSLKTEVEKLRKLKTILEQNILKLELKLHSLENENIRLTDENKTLNTTVASLTGQNNILSRQVEMASVLKAENIIAHPEKKIRNKYLKVSKAKKADRIAVSFELPENPVTAKGTKSIWIRISDPKNNILKDNNSGVFTSKEDNIIKDYSGVKEVNYDNTRQKVYFYINTQNASLEKGNYSVQIFTEGVLSGSSIFEVK